MTDESIDAPARQEPFAIMVLDETQITAPIVAATELSKLAIMAANKLAQLAEQTWVEHIDGDGDLPDRVIVHDNPKLSWWFEETRKVMADIAKINIQAETEHIGNKLKLMSIFMNSEHVPQELREQFVKYAIKDKLRKGTIEVDDPDSA